MDQKEADEAKMLMSLGDNVDESIGNAIVETLKYERERKLMARRECDRARRAARRLRRLETRTWWGRPC
jgi:hypothetical protein